MTDEMFGELMAIVGMANETNALVAGYGSELDDNLSRSGTMRRASLAICCSPNVVETSRRVSRDTTKRLEKIASARRSCLKTAQPGRGRNRLLAFLSGDARQGRIGIGYATLALPLAQPSQTRPRSNSRSGYASSTNSSQRARAGSEARKRDLLSALFSRATLEKNSSFLFGLLGGRASAGRARRHHARSAR